MIKIIKLDNKVFIHLNCGITLEENITDDEFKAICNVNDDEEILKIIDKNYKEQYKTVEEYKNIFTSVLKSQLIKYKNHSFYWDEISTLSLPIPLVKAILIAEENKEENKITAYKNFWTLMSLNTDEECRQNLYTFLQRYDFKIAKCGFFVGYKNVDSTEKKDVYTDHFSNTTTIKIGEMVILDRNKCDCNSNNECSQGLHISSSTWLKKNYFGDTGLAVLVNPANVVAVPKRSDYGKLRTCAYLPISIIKYDDKNNIIPLNVEDGFDCSYVTKVIYEGVMGTEKDSPYKIEIPKIEQISNQQRKGIQDSLLDIAKDCIVNKQFN